MYYECMKRNTLKVQLLDAQGNNLGDMSFPTDLTWLEFVSRLTLLETPAAEVTGSSTGELSPSKGNSKYERLARHLAAQADEPLTFSFKEIERILGFDLPPTARGAHARSWWANTTTHVQGRAWLAQGWRTANIDPENETLEFRRA